MISAPVPSLSASIAIELISSCVFTVCQKKKAPIKGSLLAFILAAAVNLLHNIPPLDADS